LLRLFKIWFAVPKRNKQGNDMTTKTAYESLQRELVTIERKHGLYLADPCVDLENIAGKNLEKYSDDYWLALIDAACDAAGSRAEESGYDINDLIGRVIY